MVIPPLRITHRVPSSFASGLPRQRKPVFDVLLAVVPGNVRQKNAARFVAQTESLIKTNASSKGPFARPKGKGATWRKNMKDLAATQSAPPSMHRFVGQMEKLMGITANSKSAFAMPK